MIKDYKKLKVLDSPNEDAYLYLVENAAKNDQFYMYELAEGDPFEDYFKFMKKFAGSSYILNL